jgi:hypothetical protein
MSETTTPKVYEAISAVTAALAEHGIPKDRRNDRLGFNYRSLDDILNVLAPRLAAHELVIVPRFLTRSVSERDTANGGKLYVVAVEGEFDFIAGDGSKHTARAFGEAADSGDKATAKAQSSAFKTCILQTFAIPTEVADESDEPGSGNVHNGHANGKPAINTKAEDLKLNLRVDEAFHSRGLDLIQSARIKAALLRKIGKPDLITAGPAFVEKLLRNIGAGMYDAHGPAPLAIV